jgi:HD-GYP domain-containing protein (c-di-GMP phosphodiesterase class II)
MLEKEATIPLSKVLLLPNGKGINKAYIDILLSEEIPVFCVNHSEHIHRLIPFKQLYANDDSFWQKEGVWEHHLTGYGLNKLEETARAIVNSRLHQKKEEKTDKPEPEPKSEEAMLEEAFGSGYNDIVKMTKEEKVERLSKESIWLNELLIKKSRDQIVITEALTNTTKDTAMINHAILKEIIFFADDQAKAYSHDVVVYTSEIVRTSARLLSKNVFRDELMRTIAEKSKGTVLQHITRVYLNGVAFLAYFNNMISSSSTIMKIRNSFTLKYRKFYQALLPHIDSYNLGLDQVFMGGLRVISPEMFFKWSVGFLIHDVGKAADIQYHEGGGAYDRTKVVNHVMVGYNSISQKTNYPKESALIVGYHHEYYGDPDGYGPYRDDLQEYKSSVADAKQDFCITYELESILEFKALSYFPAKVLEIIDVYDALTDPRRVYRKPLTSEEALDLISKEFIIKHHKIDPILFDIFIDFVHDNNRAETGA